MELFQKLMKKDIGKKNDLSVKNYQSDRIYSPLKGTLVPLEEVSDPVFAQGLMGTGVAILPEKGILYAPVNGTVAALFPTGHAIGLQSESGAELLIHIGIDTVELQGDGFIPHVKQGDSVLAGQVLIEFDLDKILKKQLEPITMILISNYQDLGEIQILCQEKVQPTEPLMYIKR